MNFVNKIITSNGNICPLIVTNTPFNGTGSFNPSIFYDGIDLLINVRHCQYSLYHSEKNLFEHPFGPLVYLHPESDVTLTTKNFFGKLELDLQNYKAPALVDTSKLDIPPLWTFVGLEDARIVKWDNKLYLTGVRRDTTTNGQGRMELSEIVEHNGTYVEVSRHRIPAPGKNDSYCEKNWMPVLDMPYHYVKWSNPTEVVKVDINNNTCETVFLESGPLRSFDLRGGSQVIPFDDYRIACVHHTHLFKSEAGRKNARYRHSFIVWDQDWNVVKVTDQFSFLDFEIEFCCGIAQVEDHLYLTFGAQDNSAFCLKIPKNVLKEYIFGNK
jgi:hypothetical protein